MTDGERAAFRQSFEEKSIDELQLAHNARGLSIRALREEQMVLHEIQTEKEHARERSRSAGHGQVVGGDGINDDKILERLAGSGADDGLLARVKEALRRKN